jgi:hypothetical protein
MDDLMETIARIRSANEPVAVSAAFPLSRVRPMPEVVHFPVAPAPAAADLPPTLRWVMAALLLLCMGLGAGIWVHAMNRRERLAADDAEMQMLQAQWRLLSANLQDADEARRRIEARIALPQRVVAARDLPSWTPALRSAVMRAGPEIEFVTIRARRVEAHPGACEMEVEGYATGRSARMLAEKFRRTMEVALAAKGKPAPEVRFARLEVEPAAEAGDPGDERAGFMITATFPTPPPEPEGKRAKG